MKNTTKHALAERVGFEPTIPVLPGYCFSRAGPSTTRPPLRISGQHPVEDVYLNDYERIVKIFKHRLAKRHDPLDWQS